MTDRNGENWTGDDIVEQASAPSGEHDDMEGEAPPEAHEDPHEPAEPLDSREHFGGDRTGAPPQPEESHRRDASGLVEGSVPGDDGYDEDAHPDVTGESDRGEAR